MATELMGMLSALTTMVWQDSVHYYCGRKTFSETRVSVSRDAKFVTDMTADSLQNLTVLTDPASFILDVTGCVTPLGEMRAAVGIEITHQPIPSVYTGAVQNLHRLQMIKMEDCDIREIYPGAFLILPSLESMFLRFNRIERVLEGVFNGLEVVKLYLSNNSISYIAAGALDDMPNLAVVELDSNRLKTWHTDWFSNSPNVEHLSMDSNQLTKLPAHAFSKLKNFYSTSIRLSNNSIVYIHPRAFQEVNRLYALWLNNNNINDLDDEVFLHFERLYVLSLAGNNISCLSDELLYNLQSDDIILRVEDNEPMNCECLRRIERWAKYRNFFFTALYAKNECNKKDKKQMQC